MFLIARTGHILYHIDNVRDSALERPTVPPRRGFQGKHKADTDNGSRRVKAREDQDSDSVSQAESALSQDVDDHESQLSRVISVQMRVPAQPGFNQKRYNLVQLLMVAAEEEDNRRNGRY